jgi:hypothetical protein
MPSITQLGTLLKTMEPELQPGNYVFATLGPNHTVHLADVIAVVREPEGLSVVVEESEAEALGMDVHLRCAWIPLLVNSDLTAVGLTAAFATALASAGISCNVVADNKHDHIVVPAGQAELAMHELRALQHRSS